MTKKSCCKVYGENEKNCCSGKKYPSHTSEISRLNRISGQVEGIKKMIEQRQYCLDVITQILAVRAALKAVGNNILERHLNKCVSDAMLNDNERKQKIDEIIKLFRKQ